MVGRCEKSKLKIEFRVFDKSFTQLAETVIIRGACSVSIFWRAEQTHFGQVIGRIEGHPIDKYSTETCVAARVYYCRKKM